MYMIMYVFFKRRVSPTPYLYSRASLIRAPKYHTLHTHVHLIVNSMAPESDLKQDKNCSTPTLVHYRT